MCGENLLWSSLFVFTLKVATAMVLFCQNSLNFPFEISAKLRKPPMSSRKSYFLFRWKICFITNQLATYFSKYFIPFIKRAVNVGKIIILKNILTSRMFSGKIKMKFCIVAFTSSRRGMPTDVDFTMFLYFSWMVKMIVDETVTMVTKQIKAWANIMILDFVTQSHKITFKLFYNLVLTLKVKCIEYEYLKHYSFHYVCWGFLYLQLYNVWDWNEHKGN